MGPGAADLDGLGSLQPSDGSPCHGVKADCAPWKACGVWETDGPAVLMDSAEAGEDLGVPYPDGKGRPDEAPVPVAAGRWRVRVFYKTDGCCSVGVVQLLPATGP
ncbi:Imm21 family immunity protein [Streptomyces sp. MI02-2A]|uniref:Imm21 family immunity protein n=1 Tax=unclassified Streptomyces TaxID=2593676 RepID=UPI00227733AA|nr:MULTISPECIES: Imm21 family immunity protein [unclassified Streptomyces]MDX3258393.1 Imm21 family immunity protein [Streptomyces sp. MI02-2A]